MRRTGGLVLALWRDWIRNRQAVFFSLLFPIVLLLIFSSVFAGGAPEFTVYVQNNDLDANGEATNISATYVESLNETEAISVRHLDPERNVSELTQSDQSLGSTRVLVIEDGFGAGVRNRTMSTRIEIVRNTFQRFSERLNDSQQAAIQDGLTQAEREQNETNASTATEITFLTSADDDSASIVRGILESHIAAFNNRAIGVEDPPASIESAQLGETVGLTAVDYYLPAFIAAIILLNGVVNVTSIVAQFNADGTLKRLVATPLRKRDWILANLIHQTVLALLLTAVMLLVARLVFSVSVIPGPLAIALILLGAIAFSGVGITLGSVISDPDAAIGLGNAIAFPMMFLGGVFWEIDLMPESLQFLALLMPVYHFHQGLRRLMILDSTDGVFVPFAILAALAVVFVVLSIRLTRWRDLPG